MFDEYKDFYQDKPLIKQGLKVRTAHGDTKTYNWLVIFILCLLYSWKHKRVTLGSELLQMDILIQRLFDFNIIM